MCVYLQVSKLNLNNGSRMYNIAWMQHYYLRVVCVIIKQLDLWEYVHGTSFFHVCTYHMYRMSRVCLSCESVCYIQYTYIKAVLNVLYSHQQVLLRFLYCTYACYLHTCTTHNINFEHYYIVLYPAFICYLYSWSSGIQQRFFYQLEATASKITRHQYYYCKFNWK